MRKNKKKNDPQEGKPISRRKIMRLASLAALYYIGSPLVGKSQLVRSRKTKKVKLKIPKHWAAHRSKPLPKIVKQPLFGTLNTAQPASQAEIKLTRLLADKISHAFTIAVANPNERFPRNSMAGEISKKLLKLDPKKRTAARVHARSLLNLPLSERKLYFGNYAYKNTSVHKVVQPNLDANLQSLVKEAVRIRVKQYKGEIIDYLKKEAQIRSGNSTETQAFDTKLSNMTTSKKAGIGPRLIKTSIFDAGAFIKTPSPTSILRSGYHITINSASQTLDFKWRTKESGAGKGLWAIFESNTGKLVAAGSAGKGKQGVFRVYFKKFLPSKPPDPKTPGLYYIQVFPYPPPPERTGRFSIAPQLMPRTAEGFKRGAVGPPSRPLPIYYCTGQDQQFTGFLDVYRNLDFYIDWIEMIAESCESGVEEFHITGFVQEESNYFAGNKSKGLPPRGEQSLHKFHKIGRIDPDWVDKAAYFKGPERRYRLQNPNSEFYPKVFTILFSVMEEDNGEAVYELIEKLWGIAESELRDLIHSVVYTAVEELVGYIAEAILREIIEQIQMVAKLVSSVTSLLSNLFTSMIMMVISDIISKVIEGKHDDYYGVTTIHFVLPTNLVDYVKSLPGKVGPGGSYILKRKETKQMVGPPCPGGATWDGAVKLSYHWELKGKEMI